MNYYLGPYEWVDESWQPPATTVGAIDLRNLTHMGTPVAQDGVGFFATTGLLDVSYDLLGQGDLRDINSSSAMKVIWDGVLGYTPNGDKLVDLLYDHLTLGSDPLGAAASKPLLPGNGLLVLHLGGHSIVKATQFRLGHSPESNQVISVLQEDYRKIRQGTMGGGIPANQHRRVLDFWGEKYRVKNPHQIFIPNDLPVELPIPHSTSISENFDGADNAAIGKQLTWVEPTTGAFWDNFSSTGRCLDPGSETNENRACYANSALSGADQECSIDIVVLENVSASQAGPACRRSNSAVTYYFARLAINSTPSFNVTIEKVVTGTKTLIGTVGTVTMTLPDTVKLTVSGSSLEAFFNDVSESTATDTAITGNLFCGLWGLRNTGVDRSETDNWAAQDFIAGGGANASPLLMGLL